ncbi:MAG: DNA recombination protein RmuC [Bacteroidales bacterium]|jgi:DNA recombination protein RmuC|nr:DNA recombination protein RmuC [Bacteroidales bacterium]
MINLFLFLIIGLAAGFTAGWFISKFFFQGKTGLSIEEADKMKNEVNNLHTELQVKEERLSNFIREMESLKKEKNDQDELVIHLRETLKEKESDLKHLHERLQDHKKEVDELQQRFKTEFKNLANEILEEKTGKFTEQNKINLDTILKPLQEKIKDFEQKVEETHKKDIADRASIQERIKHLVETSNQISEDARNLTKALKGDSKTQGGWGELILENILERSGLVKDREYFVQQSFKDAQGNRFQPDVIVRYPGDRSVVIDSKVSLTAYEKYVSATDDVLREKGLNDHLASVKNHIKQLSEKNYQDIYQLKSLDFVMMFMPVEPAYLVAIQKDPELWNFAYEKRILLISPTNLIAALKMIASMWLQEYQSQNVMEIARQSGALYDKFVGLVNDLQDIGNKLDSTRKAYDHAMNKISTGKGNLISRVQNIKELGAKTKKEIPADLLDD